MFNRFLVRPLLTMLTWARRNPLLTVACFAGAWFLVRVVLPSGLKATFQGVLGMILGKVFAVLTKLPVIGPAVQWMSDRLVGFVWTAVQWLAAVSIGSLFPPLGVFIVAWQIMSSLSNGNRKADMATGN